LKEKIIFWFPCLFLFSGTNLFLISSNIKTISYLNFDSVIFYSQNSYSVNENILNTCEKRIFFGYQNPDTFLIVSNLYTKTYVFLALKNIPYALANYARLRPMLRTTNNLNVFFYNLSLLMFLNENPLTAKQFLDSITIKEPTDNPSLFFKYHLLNAFCFFEMNQPKLFKEELLTCINSDTLLSQESKIKWKYTIDSLINTFRYPKNLKKAKILSFLFPGAGYLYLNKASYFVTSFLLFSLSAAFIYYNIIWKCYFVSLTAGVFFIKTSYFSGINGLYDVYHEKVVTKQKNQNKRIYSFILSKLNYQ